GPAGNRAGPRPAPLTPGRAAAAAPPRGPTTDERTRTLRSRPIGGSAGGPARRGEEGSRRSVAPQPLLRAARLRRRPGARRHPPGRPGAAGPAGHAGRQPVPPAPARRAGPAAVLLRGAPAGVPGRTDPCPE